MGRRGLFSVMTGLAPIQFKNQAVPRNNIPPQALTC